MSIKTITVDLENCYGIRSLRREFDFSTSNVIAIYAPNGVMKSSLAQTFRDHANDVNSQDRVFPQRATRRQIVDSSGTTLSKATVFVVSPYDEEFGITEKTSVLLVNSDLRKEYESLQEEIISSKREFLKEIKTQSGSKKDLEQEISLAFTPHPDQFFQALIRARSEVESQAGAPLAGIRYDEIFNDRALDFLQTQDFRFAIEEYVKKYNELLDSSRYFSRDTFNYFNASAISKSLASNGFFKANHSINLNSDTREEVTSEKELEALVAAEKEKIASDSALRTKFAAIEKLLTKNAQLRTFQDYISSNEILLPKLTNVDALKEELWKSYFKSHMALYCGLIDKYRQIQQRLQEIEKEAQSQRTKWERVIDIFNSRFFVPFKLVLENRERVMLGTDKAPRLGFLFDEGENGLQAEVNKDTLMKTLSTGEKKALYILNIIFEVETRKEVAQDTLFVFDDIADSFDYRNKYAIIQYLIDISEQQRFRQLLLTHNFDFFRTVNSRFVPYRQCLMSERTRAGVSIVQASGVKNPFINDWKPKFFSDERKRLACIPFLRNLIEYSRGSDDGDFTLLSSLLHWRPDSRNINQAHLDEVYRRMFDDNGSFGAGGDCVVDSIERVAHSCSADSSFGIAEIEKKVVLSIAIRLLAERFMVSRINDSSFWDQIDLNQTYKLARRFDELFPSEAHALEIIKRVALMTPENIHLNSFMYEPILDMSDEHLQKLFEDVRNLGNP